MYLNFVKPVIDRIIAAMLMMVLFVPAIGISLLVLISTLQNPFFLHRRAGLNGRYFYLYKFRTMRSAKIGNKGQLLSDEARVTKIGKFLRRYSIDELPQLLNVLKGDISLVGPRPLPVEYLPLYDKEQALRHQVHPGLTGLAQVKGRNALSWEERFKLDVHYVRNASLLLDLKIILLTIIKIFVSSADEHVFSEEFKGTSNK